MGVSKSHFDYKDKPGATRIVETALFHEIPSGLESIEHDHGTSKDPEVYDVAYYIPSDIGAGRVSCGG